MEDRDMGKNGGSNHRNASTGRFVTAERAARSPSTTVTEPRGASGSSGAHYRSAITGRYVTESHGKRSPNTTVRED